MMTKLVSVAKKYYFVPFFALFAVLTARALHFVTLAGGDWVFAANARGGFFEAVATGAREYGEGIAGSFLRTSFTAIPQVIWKIVCFAALLFSDFAAAIIVSRALPDAADDKSEKSGGRFAAALTFTTFALAVIPSAVLRDSVLSIAGTVHLVIPGALLLGFWLAAGKAGEKKSSWYLPVLAFFAALLSWQAALGAFVLAVWHAVCAARERKFRVSCVLAAAAPAAVFVAHLILWNVPGFPAEVSRMAALRSFFGEVFAESGLLYILAALSLFVCVRVFAERVVPVFRSDEKPPVSFILYFALALSSAIDAAVLVIRSPLAPDVTVSGSLTVIVTAVTAALTAAVYAAELREDRRSAPAAFSLAALVLAASTLPTYTFGGGSFYLPILLMTAVCGCEFLRVLRVRAALTVICALGAYLAASLCLTNGKLLIAAMVVVFAAVLELSPLLRRVRLTETLAVIFAVLTLWAIGNALAFSADRFASNEAKAEEFKAEPQAFLILDAAPKDGVSAPSPSAGQIPSFLKYHGIDEGAKVFFIDPDEPVIPEDLGDLNGDGKINNLDTLTFLRAMQK